MTELWRLAGADQALAGERDTSDDTARRMLEAERDSLAAEAKALQTLNTELQRHRATAELSLAEARALLSRREAALEETRTRIADLEQALARTRMDLEVAIERARIVPRSRSAPATAIRVSPASKRRAAAKGQRTSRPPKKKSRTLPDTPAKKRGRKQRRRSATLRHRRRK